MLRLLILFSFLAIAKLAFGQSPESVLVMPSGSYAQGTLMTGVAVALPEVVPDDPSPVLIRIDSGFFTPAGGIVNMEGCLAYGRAEWADHISRVVVEIYNISCPFKGKYYEKRIKGYLFDTRGNLGFRGRIVPRTKYIYGERIETGTVYVKAGTPTFIYIEEGTNFSVKRRMIFDKFPLTLTPQE